VVSAAQMQEEIPASAGTLMFQLREKKEERMKSTAFWNRHKSASVVLEKLKEFTITGNVHDKNYSVKGWYNETNFFVFGSDFETLPIAQEFLEKIHTALKNK
jgi:hypothetical protein